MQPIRIFSAVPVFLLILLSGCSEDLNEQLVTAAKEGNTATAQTLLARGADANAQSIEGRIALMVAAESGHTEMVRLLLAEGAEVNAQDNDGRTVLILAAESGHSETVQALLAEGADVSAKDHGGRIALMAAALKGTMTRCKPCWLRAHRRRQKTTEAEQLWFGQQREAIRTSCKPFWLKVWSFGLCLRIIGSTQQTVRAGQL